MITRQQIRDRRGEILEIARRYGASDVRIIGSVARGDTRRDSDLDLVVRFEAGRGLVMDLRELLGVEVDVIDEEAMRPRFRNKVLREAVQL